MQHQMASSVAGNDSIRMSWGEQQTHVLPSCAAGAALLRVVLVIVSGAPERLSA